MLSLYCGNYYELFVTYILRKGAKVNFLSSDMINHPKAQLKKKSMNNVQTTRYLAFLKLLTVFLSLKVGVAVWVSLSESHHPVEFETMSSVKTLQLYSSAHIGLKFFQQEHNLIFIFHPFLFPQDISIKFLFNFCIIGDYFIDLYIVKLCERNNDNSSENFSPYCDSLAQFLLPHQRFTPSFCETG